MSNIHSTALVSAKAELASDVKVGAFAVIEDGVEIGPGTTVGHHAVITGQTRIGKNNKIGVGAVIGLEPQDLSYKGAPSGVEIGDNNTLREYVQVHRGTQENSKTVIGNDNFIMGFAHIAHNCYVGNKVIFANGVLLGGHAEVQDYAFLSGHCMVHQFGRIGAHTMMSGGASMSLDVPPYCISGERNVLYGINVIGLQRRGFKPETIREIKNIFKEVFLSKEPLTDLIPKTLEVHNSLEVQSFLKFIQSSKRGICRP